MNARWLLLLAPWILAAMAFALFTSMGSSATLAGYYFDEGLLARAAATAGCLIAAFQFDSGDYLRRAWSFLGACYILLIVNAVFFGGVSHVGAAALSPSAAALSGALVSLANICTIIGTLSVSSAWRVAGLDLNVSPRSRRLATLGSLLVGLAVAGPTAVSDAALVLHGNLNGLKSLASDVGDIVTLGVLAPVLLTARALRGGSLAWPWTLFAMGTFGWLLFDGVSSVTALLAVDESQFKPLEEAFRLIGCFSILSAGILQALAIERRST